MRFLFLLCATASSAAGWVQEDFRGPGYWALPEERIISTQRGVVEILPVPGAADRLDEFYAWLASIGAKPLEAPGLTATAWTLPSKRLDGKRFHDFLKRLHRWGIEVPKARLAVQCDDIVAERIRVSLKALMAESEFLDDYRRRLQAVRALAGAYSSVLKDVDDRCSRGSQTVLVINPGDPERSPLPGSLLEDSWTSSRYRQSDRVRVPPRHRFSFEDNIAYAAIGNDRSGRQQERLPRTSHARTSPLASPPPADYLDWKPLEERLFLPYGVTVLRMGMNPGSRLLGEQRILEVFKKSGGLPLERKSEFLDMAANALRGDVVGECVPLPAGHTPAGRGLLVRLMGMDFVCSPRDSKKRRWKEVADLRFLFPNEAAQAVEKELSGFGELVAKLRKGPGEVTQAMRDACAWRGILESEVKDEGALLTKVPFTQALARSELDRLAKDLVCADASEPRQVVQVILMTEAP